MVERSLEFARRAMGADVAQGESAGSFRGAAIDSRAIDGGELFFALPGERVDGHDFTGRAARAGAAGLVVHRPVEDCEAAPSPESETELGTDGLDPAWLRVDDTFAALHELTRAVRREVPEKLVAITGSVGKTTTKELLAAVLGRKFRVAKSPGNLNNLYGFPLALLGIADDTEWMVAEMGMSTPDELAGVSRLGQPDVALLLNVRAVHLENFASVEAIAEAKSEIFAGLAPDGLMIVRADDAHALRVARRHAAAHPGTRLLTFGSNETSPEADVRASRVRSAGEAGDRARDGVAFQLDAPAFGVEALPVVLGLHGLYNAWNALAAATCGLALGVAPAEIAAALAAARPAAMRGAVHRIDSGPTIIDDSYNSNPDAALAALESALALDGGTARRIAVLGDMLELGPTAPALHHRVGAAAARDGFLVVGVGPLARDLVAGAREAQSSESSHDGARIEPVWLADAAAAGDWLVNQVGPSDVVLVKGSRGVGLDRAVAQLLESFETQTPRAAGGGH